MLIYTNLHEFTWL